MKSTFAFIFFLFGLNAFSSAAEIKSITPAHPQTTTEVVLQVDEGFASLVDHLDPNGLSYSLVNGPYELATIAPTFNYLMMMMEVAATAAPNEMISPAIISYVKALPEKLGTHQYVGRGSSVIKWADGRYRSKYVYQTTPNADGLLWKMDGKSVDVRAHLQALPETTVAMTHFSVNLQDLYTTFKSDFPSPQVTAATLQAETMLGDMGLPLNSLLESANQGFTIGVSFNEAAEWVIPIDDLKIRSPEIGTFVILSDTDQMISAFLLKTLQTHSPIPVMESTLEGISIHMVPLPLPVSTAVSLQIAHANGKLYLASNAPLMQTLLQKRTQGADIPLMNLLAKSDLSQASVMWMADPKISQLMQKVMQEALIASDTENAMGLLAMSKFYAQQLDSIPDVLLSGREGDLSKTLVLHRGPMSNAMSGSTLMTIPMVTGLAAAIAIPSFSKAREKAQDKSCIHNLRLIEAAKDQRAIEENLPSGAEVKAADIQDYIKNGIPVCPGGGDYILGTVDTAPECTVHGSSEW